jgi:ubiquinone/menaquinone biosynthesis C-methylase UbiE
MNIIYRLKVKIYNAIRTYRFKVVQNLLDESGTNLLDIGCQELVFYEKLKEKYKITAADYAPRHDSIKQEDVQNLSFADNSFDIVICQQVLEHVPHPVRAMAELKRVARKQLIISVPYEPFFTLARFLTWEKEHLWAVTPKALNYHLGQPVYEKKLFFKRYYLAAWKFDEEKT